MANVVVKIIFFSVIDEILRVYFPNTLPSIAVTHDLSLEKAVASIFTKMVKKVLTGQFTEQLQTISSSKNEITIAYYILLPQTDIEKNDLVNWHKPETVSKKNPDYEIISYAIQRLQWKIEYTNVIYSLLPEEFTLSELQTIYEAILGRKLDKRNFRKKMLSLHFLTVINKKRIQTARPAQMYRFTKRVPIIVKIFS